MCIWRQCNKDPSAALGMTVLGERIGSQGRRAVFLEEGILVSQPSPLGEVGRCPKVVFKSRVTSHNNDTSKPLETEVPQRDFRVWPNPKRRLACPLRRLPVRPNGPRRRRRMDPRSGVKNYVRLPISLKRHPDRSGGILPADR